MTETKPQSAEWIGGDIVRLTAGYKIMQIVESRVGGWYRFRFPKEDLSGWYDETRYWHRLDCGGEKIAAAPLDDTPPRKEWLAQ